MNRILTFGEFSRIDSAVFRLKSAKDYGDEIVYEGVLSLNGEKIAGQIFADADGDLECYQFYDKDGRDIAETYGQEAVDSMVRSKLKRLIKKNIE